LLERLSAAKAALAKNTAKTITNNFFIFYPFNNFADEQSLVLRSKGFAFGNLANCRSALLGNLRPPLVSLPVSQDRDRGGNNRLYLSFEALKCHIANAYFRKTWKPRENGVFCWGYLI
jgi:hypothetical protein